MTRSPDLRLRTLGELSVRRDGALVPDSSRPLVLALLTYLVARRDVEVFRRDHLMALFWPESGTRKARQSLRRHLYLARGIAGDETLMSRGRDEIVVDAGRIWCDARAVEGAAAAGRHEDVLHLYAGEFAPGLHVSSHAFEEWVQRRREDLRALAVASGEALVDRALGRDDPRRALEYAEDVARLAPLDESVVRRVMDLRVELGDVSGAMREFDALAARLREALSVEPSPVTILRVERLRSMPGPSVGREARPEARSGGADMGQPTPTWAPYPRNRRGWMVPVAAGLCLALVVGIRAVAAPWAEPPRAEGRIAAADALLEFGDVIGSHGSSVQELDRAVALYRAAAELTPERAAPHAAVARVSARIAGTWPWEAGRLDTARSAVVRASLTDAADGGTDARFARAVVLYHEGRDPRTVLGELEAVFEVRPGDPAVLLYIGLANLAAGAPMQALEALAAARGLDGSDARIATAQGWALVMAGRPDEALLHFEEGWALAPDDVWAYLSLFRGAVAAGALDRAEALARERPPGLDARHLAPGLGHVAYHRGELEEAYRLLSEEDRADHRLLGIVAFLRGDEAARRRHGAALREEAEAALGSATTSAEEHPSPMWLAHIHARLALAGALLGDAEAAERHGALGRALHPMERDAVMGLPPVVLHAQARAVLGDPVGAAELIRPWLQRPSPLVASALVDDPLLGGVVGG